MVALDGDGWRCVDCRIWLPTWPSDMEPCPGKGKFCPRCRVEVVDHPMSEFASDDPEVREWQCGRCAGGAEALYLAGEATYDN